MATTLIQCLITFIFICVAGVLSHGILHRQNSRHSTAPSSKNQEAWLLKDDDTELDASKEVGELTSQRPGSREIAVNSRFRDVVSVSFVFLLRVGLSNLAIT